MQTSPASAIGATLDEVWSTVSAPGPTPGRDECRLVPESAPVGSGYRVADIAGATVGAATVAANRLAGDGSGRPEGSVVIETDHALAAWRGFVTVDGSSPPTWAPLSGRYRTAEGRFVQLHCNFPHHAAGVASRLGVAEDRAAFEAAIATWDAFELEEALRLDGMICAAYRTPEEWAVHPHAEATASLPLIEVERLGDAEPRPVEAARSAGSASGPATGVRVLDCSRVLAGPVCGRTLAAHGADVLRVGAAHLPHVEGALIVTGFGKRNASVDLDTADGRGVFGELLAGADVFVDAYRPGALASRGFSAERAAELNPGIVAVEICAFDRVGPWADRRGFDSIVQSTTGIALGQAAVCGSSEPVHLPVQALDFATGYLAAFAAARLLARQRTEGGSWLARLSLLRTRNWLAGLGGPAPFEPGAAIDTDRFLHTVASPFGELQAVRPVAGRWDRPPAPLGSSPASWAGR